MKLLPGLVFILLFIRSEYSIAQEPVARDSAITANASQVTNYEHFSRSNVTAVVLGWCIPSTGHAYAGNWARGLPFAAARAGTLIGMLVSEGQQNRDGNRNLLPVASGLLYLTFTVWEVIDASSQVDKYNDDLRNALQKSSYKFDLSPIEKGIALRFVWEI